MAVTIREAKRADCGRIGEISTKSWQFAYQNILPPDYLAAIRQEERTARFEKVLESGSLMFVAEVDGMLVGFISGGRSRGGVHPDHDGEVYAIYIDPDYTNRGIGKLLLQSLENRLAAEGIQGVFAWMLVGNEARHFYEGLGGKKIAEDQLEIDGVSYPEIAYGWKIADR
ncbi:GNAT family N-acetyltransferase [Terribacillus sp. 179-K 1B1 HS]|uniref:GNAT family N-acetyltransferase n=1 Tax=Terribacillus sp. 179-K 1B1 HS TaxID=3142388 RepID=UPI0039A012D8